MVNMVKTEANLMTDSKRRRLVLVSGLGIAAIAAIAVAFYMPYAASAQQMPVMPRPSWMMQDGAWSNNTHLAMPKINGSINVPQLIDSQVKVSFSDAAKTAEGQVDGGKGLEGHIGIVQGYLVYSFMVSDPTSQTCYMVIVDAGNGTVLYKSQGFQMDGFGHHGFGGPLAMHKFDNMM